MAGLDHIVLPVEDPSHVAEARREAGAMARGLGFGEECSATLGVAITETATNIIKHAGAGRILIRALRDDETAGLEVLAIDKGPGIKNVTESMRDGYSTAGSPGTGLGSISRMASDLDIYSQPGKGTVMRFEIWPRGHRKSAASLEVGAISVATRGESVCGDDWGMHGSRQRFTVMVADGLGHGEHAAIASRTAVELLQRHPGFDPAGMIEAAHAALKGTRGAAVAVAALDLPLAKGTYCGVGNISGITYIKQKSRHLVSHNGTLGHNARKIHQFEFEFPTDALLIMFSDGLVTHWTLDDYPGLSAKHPGLIAAVLYRDHYRGRDDVTIAVVRNIAS